MNWEALGAIGEIVGSVAVVVTLGYVAMQMRQNTSAIRTASRQEIVSGFRETNRLWMDPDAARAYAQGVRDYPDMPFRERALFGNMISDSALFFQGAFALYESGQLEEETYQAYLDWFACTVATPGGTAWWEEVGRPFFFKRAVKAVDERLAQGQLPDITQLGFLRLDDAPPAPSAGTASVSGSS